METPKDDAEAKLAYDAIEMKRHDQIAYEYLCHLEEAKRWIEDCLGDRLPSTELLEEYLRNGVYLARLAAVLCPDLIPSKKIYDVAQLRYEKTGLHFRHTDNINHFLRSIENLQLPTIFWPETTDIYEKKNMPRLIYCIHALSLHLFKLGKAPQIQDLYGKVSFSNDTINAVSLELQKFGIDMPSFRKIGGILANQLPVDEAALHAAIIAINEAVGKGEAEETLNSLSIPDAHLEQINPQFLEAYQERLLMAKQRKASAARNRSQSLDDSYLPDVYDEMLTQAELQGNINHCNVVQYLEMLREVVDEQDVDGMMSLLVTDTLSLSHVLPQNGDWYLIVLEKLLCQMRDSLPPRTHVRFTREGVQESIVSANSFAVQEMCMLNAVRSINSALECDSPTTTYDLLATSEAMLPQGLKEAAAIMYHNELKQTQQQKGSALTYDELVKAVEVLRCITWINNAVDGSEEETIMMALLQPECRLANIEPAHAALYRESLMCAKDSRAKHVNKYLSPDEIQTVIDLCNEKAAIEESRAIALEDINRAIAEGYPRDTYKALNSLSADLDHLLPDNKELYQYLLQTERMKKKETGSENDDLWLDEVKEAIALANNLAHQAYRLALKLSAINISLDKQDAVEVYHYLTNPEFSIPSVIRECKGLYLQQLLKFRRYKISEGGHVGTGWLFTRLPDSHHGFFFNVRDKRLLWFKTRDMVKDPTLLNRGEISIVVNAVNEEHNRQVLFKTNEKFIIKLQAAVRGYLARREFKDRFHLFINNVDSIIKIQKWWRSIYRMKCRRERQEYFEENLEAIVCLQSYVRMWLERKKYLARLDFFKQHEDAVVKIQSFWRSSRMRDGYKLLMLGGNPTFSVIIQFIYLLESSCTDYQEEMSLQSMKQRISDEIRRNQSLEAELKEMDIKIGLLVKNRISLEEVLKHNMKLKEYRRVESSVGTAHARGLKALNKVSQKKLEAYQHLFYLLQTNPVYLGRLINNLPQNQQTKFVEKVIFSLYNFGANARDEYLLLKLFTHAVELEIQTNTSQPSDFLSSNPFVVKLIVGLSRSPHAVQSVRRLLQGPVLAVLNDPDMIINTNAVDVYKQWINTLEGQSGNACGMPYDVSPKEALEHDEVRNSVKRSVERLRMATQRFLKVILRSPDLLPFTIRYCGRVIKACLQTQYPKHPEKEILKVVANMVYYRYLNSAIIAPDSCDIVDAAQVGAISNEKRRTLGSIAKMLQFVASNKGFGAESPLLAVLNPFIRDCHEQFKQFLTTVCDVEEPESYFGIDRFTDLTLIARPTIHISLKEMLDTHLLLIQYQDNIAPSHEDPIHDVLDDLSQSDVVGSLFGNGSGDHGGPTSSEESAEICLTLGPRIDPSTSEDQSLDLEILVVRTKRLVVDILSSCSCAVGCRNLVEVLNSVSTEEDNQRHTLLIQSREQLNESMSGTPRPHFSALHNEMKLPLDEKKRRVEENLAHLETLGFVNVDNHYNDLMDAIVRDIRHLRGYRQRRKQDLVRLKSTLQRLLWKRQFQQDQIDYYSRYCVSCMQNLVRRRRRNIKKGGPNAAIGQLHCPEGGRMIKFTAAELSKKGVVMEIEGLSGGQFKNLQFEISEMDGEVGLFLVVAKFMGVLMDKVELVFQDLLQLQYEGVAVMRLFNRAKVNVNLLIFLINKKFYSR